MSTEIVVVPHTHWDREWYEPFQRFRLRLVALLDEVLDTMEREPDYHFTLDGQLACVDDYLEVRPENRDRIAALVEAGRLAVGPWQILLDEFLCSGENIIRNLELGMDRADKLGGAMPVGYLPDMFGHTAQMPQILRKAGLLHACVYRGVPSSVTTDAFAWTAPDGTAIRTQYLPAGGYGNGAHLFHDSEGLKERAAAFVRTMREWHGPEGSLLAMYGTDHSAPRTRPARDGGRHRRPHGHPVRLHRRVLRRRGRPAAGPRRAALPRPRQHPARRHLRARPRQAGHGPRRADGRALRRAARRALGRGVARTLPRHGLVAARRRQRPRLRHRLRRGRHRPAGRRPHRRGRAPRAGRPRHGDRPARRGRAVRLHRHRQPDAPDALRRRDPRRRGHRPHRRPRRRGPAHPAHRVRPPRSCSTRRWTRPSRSASCTAPSCTASTSPTGRSTTAP
ncbi:hypothetical protein [Nonomuraea salmonea]|uniref:glycoside hydrolase family 38 N-terminal domain-containing protein n=1 Tax=Nonomuraea salmonea TaxID=46181 RepID=UPI0031F03AC4